MSNASLHPSVNTESQYDDVHQLATSAKHAQFKEVLNRLKSNPELVNSTRPFAGATFTALHQVAHHGRLERSLPAAQSLLQLGADKGLRVGDGRTAYDIAVAKCPDQPELHALLRPNKFTLSQLLRREILMNNDFFTAFIATPGSIDGAIFIAMCKRLLLVECPRTPRDVVQALMATFDEVCSSLTLSTDDEHPSIVGGPLKDEINRLKQLRRAAAFGSDGNRSAGTAVPSIGNWRGFIQACAAAASRSFSTQQLVIAAATTQVTHMAFALDCLLDVGDETTVSNLANVLGVAHITPAFFDSSVSTDAVCATLHAQMEATFEDCLLLAAKEDKLTHDAITISLEELKAHCTAWVLENRKLVVQSDASCSPAAGVAVPSIPSKCGYANSPLHILSPPPVPSSPGEEPKQRDDIRWIALGDWGEPFCTVELAKRINSFLEKYNIDSIDFIILLGDNFYPSGVTGVDDKRFREQWAEAFLAYPKLCVPYKVVIGNHDRQQMRHLHQVQFADTTRNTFGLWQHRGEGNPAAPSSTCFDFQCGTSKAVKAGDDTIGRHVAIANFYVIDTCAAQWNSRRHDPNIEATYAKEQEWLGTRFKSREEELDEANALLVEEGSSLSSWSIVCGHHGMYTNGSGHHTEGLCLRNTSYTATVRGKAVQKMAGLGLESKLVDAGVDGYYCGHDHVAQHSREQRIDHIGTGNAIECGYYQGHCPEDTLVRPVDWFEDRHRGFTYNRIVCNEDGQSSDWIVQFVESRSGDIIQEIRRRKHATTATTAAANEDLSHGQDHRGAKAAQPSQIVKTEVEVKKKKQKLPPPPPGRAPPPRR